MDIFSGKGKSSSSPVTSLSSSADSLSIASSAVQLTSSQFSSDFNRMRSSIVEKILDEQNRCLEILTFHVQVLKPKLDEMADGIAYNIDEHQVRELMGNSEVLYDLEKQIKSKINTIPEGCKDTLAFEKTTIGSSLYNMKDCLNAYEEYFASFSRIIKLATHLEKTSVQDEIEKLQNGISIDETKMKSEGFFRAVLFQPLYHVCQMSVLLKMLSVFTTPTHADLRDIIKAYQVYQNLVVKIDALYRKPLLEDAYFVCDFFQKEWDRVGISNKNGFATKRGGNVKSWKIRWFTIRHYELKYFEEPLAEKPLNTLDLRQCQKAFPDNTQDKQHCVGLEFRDRTYYVYFTGINEKTEWMHAIAWKIYLLKSVSYRASQAIGSIKSGSFPTVLSMIA